MIQSVRGRLGRRGQPVMEVVKGCDWIELGLNPHSRLIRFVLSALPSQQQDLMAPTAFSCRNVVNRRGSVTTSVCVWNQVKEYSKVFCVCV